MKTLLRTAVMAGVITASLSAALVAQTESLQTHVAALKQSLAQSREQLKRYQWTETTVVLYKGEEKSKKVYLAQYGPDGTVQRTEIAASPEKHEGGLRGHIMKKKREEMTADMKRAVELVKLYVPPDPARIEAAKNSGNASVNLTEPGKRIRLNFANYLMPGDMLGVDIDPTTNRLLGATVSTYMDDPKDPVDLLIQFATLPDGTTYPAAATLEVKSKNLTVDRTNSNYTKKATE